MKGHWLCCLTVMTLVSAASASANDIRTIGAEAALLHDARQDDLRYVTWHPVEGQEVQLNPPRFRWPWDMENPRIEESVPAGNRWDFQIAADRDCRDILFETQGVEYNFFNAIPALQGPGPFYWRVREYQTGQSPRWSRVLSFTIAKDARIWDRLSMLDRRHWPKEHPRLYWNAESWTAILRLKDTDPFGQKAYQQLLRTAQQFVQSDTWKNFPKDDRNPSRNYFSLAKNTLIVALAHKITGDNQFDGHKERMLRIASWGPGEGYSSPEGMPPTKQKWSTHLNEELALYYDWFYHDLSAGEQDIMRGSLKWRLEHTLWSFCFTRNKGALINGSNLSNRGTSHAFQNIMISLTGCLAVWDELPMAERGLEWALNYLTGITTGFGKVSAHNEGPGYGNGKTTWLGDAVWAVRTALPQVHIEKLPQLEGLIDFFDRITPVGMQYSSWGNRGFKEWDWLARRYSGNYLLGYLTGSREAIANAEASGQRLQELGRSASIYSPWVGLAIPHYAEKPSPKLEQNPVRVWPVTGWVTAGTRVPSDYNRWRENVGIVFHARPVGSYSHAFASDNAFDLFAYGQTLVHGGGGTQNRDRFPDATMSHNTVLIDGKGQTGAQTRGPWSARLVAFQENPEYVYMAGDATNAYAPDTGLQRFVRHILFMRGKYFVIYDELMADRPAGFQWLFHLNPDAGLQIDQSRGFDLRVKDVNLRVRHLAGNENLTIENRPGDKGRVNPLTGEDYSFKVGLANGSNLTEDMQYAQHIWVSTTRPVERHNFLSVLYPWRSGDVTGKIERINDHTVRIILPDGTRDIIAFGNPVPGATLVVDIAAIRQAAVGED